MTAWLDAYGVRPPKVKDDFTSAPPQAGQVTVSAPAVPTPLGSVTLSPGFTPDYRGLILSDPTYMSWKNNATFDVQRAAAARRAALKALAIQYGGLGPASDAYGDIDQATLDLAKQNQYSDVARLGRAYDQGINALKQGLAARGMLQSSDLEAGLNEADYQHGANEYDMGQKFANAFQQAINDYAAVEQQARANEWQAVQGAEQSVFSNPLNVPSEPTSGTLIPDWQSRYGVPVYAGPDGSLYTLDPSGNPVPYEPAVTPPPTSPPAQQDWANSFYGPSVGGTGSGMRWA